MKHGKRALACAGVLVLAAVLWIWSVRPFGVREANLEAHARQDQRVPEGWRAAGGTGEETTGLLFYAPNGGADDFIFSVYAKNGGLSFGWFFRAGGSLGTVADGIAVYQEDGEQVFLSMNTPGICRAVAAGSGEEIPIESGRPFVLVRPEAEKVTFYNAGGEAVPCWGM